ncbi:uncharacterized protein [Drosophila bipectinata]|uniref:uncharacterized protein n=1 Tax=Drosophila bipectinata TaxID=42026 RepID=UPI0038B34579
MTIQAEVNIIQLSIPESDLYDEHLMEDFLELISQLGHLHMDTLPLLDTPSKVLAVRSTQLIFPVWQEFRGMHYRPDDHFFWPKLITSKRNKIFGKNRRVATILDSRFKKDGFLSQSNADQAAKVLENELFNTLSKTQHDPPTPPNPEPEKKKCTFLQQKVAVKSKSTRTDAIKALRQYLEAPNSPENVEPLEFYKTCPDSMEALKSLAKQYFCVPASSTASERIFSKAGLVISERSSLKPNIVNKLLFLNKNSFLYDLN